MLHNNAIKHPLVEKSHFYKIEFGFGGAKIGHFSKKNGKSVDF
jgi:hypothetical protein